MLSKYFWEWDQPWRETDLSTVIPFKKTIRSYKHANISSVIGGTSCLLFPIPCCYYVLLDLAQVFYILSQFLWVVCSNAPPLGLTISPAPLPKPLGRGLVRMISFRNSHYAVSSSLQILEQNVNECVFYSPAQRSWVTHPSLWPQSLRTHRCLWTGSGA